MWFTLLLLSILTQFISKIKYNFKSSLDSHVSRDTLYFKELLPLPPSCPCKSVMIFKNGFSNPYIFETLWVNLKYFKLRLADLYKIHSFCHYFAILHNNKTINQASKIMDYAVEDDYRPP